MSRLRLIVVALLVAGSAACATRAVPQPFPEAGDTGAGPGDAGASARAEAQGHRVVAAALDFRGVPYRNGGADPTGFDCSGLVAYVFGLEGVSLPRQTAAQFKAGAPVPLASVRPGDLLFFSTVSPGASHVAIAIDGDEFVHAPSSRGVVRVERLTVAYWRSRFIGARRVIE